MKTSQRVQILTDFFTMKQSLDAAMDEAGGTCFTIKELQEMTALDLLLTLCTNNVRFVFKKPEE